MSSVTQAYGANIAFIEELYEKYRTNPDAVSASWREFFADYQPVFEEDLEQVVGHGSSVVGGPVVLHSPQDLRPTTDHPAPAPAPAPKPVPAPPPSSGNAVILRGAAGKIAQNMESSLAIPTATSVRNIPVKALEENRRVINNHFALTGQSKASFTHVIAYAIVKALKQYSRMNSAFAQADGQPTRIDREDVNLGIAIDIERKDGTRSLLVPNIKRAQTMDFAQFLKAYNDVVRKARNNTLEVSDFEGTTISLTNPGTIGTVASVPRLMPSQGTIVATGQIDYSAEYSASDPAVLADLGISKVMTMTSTYDHRIIQGAESGAFLARIHELLIGEDNFYDDLYRDLRIPYEPVRWGRDRNRLHMGTSTTDELVAREAAVLQMINAYRVRGHLLADLDPLEYKVGHHPELNPQYYGLTIWDLDREFICGGLCGKAVAKLRDILDTLRETYCGHIGPEYMHIQETDQKRWLQERMEPTRNKQPLDRATKRRILLKLNDAESFERFLHTKYVGHKRFSLEGAESLVPMLDDLFNAAVDDGVVESVIGMAHRGRLNVLANILGKSYEQIFREFEGDIDPSTREGSGDVKYHLGADGTHTTPDGKTLKLTLASNPSHLEAVDPIVEGMARAAGTVTDRGGAPVFDPARSLPVLIHGDAAFPGQGIVAETLNLSRLPGYDTGGTIHIIVNNQLGFTADARDSYSTSYASGLARGFKIPIVHVNADDPEACVEAARLAVAYRSTFNRDFLIDLIGYRRHGHNEGDEPSFTQPLMYQKIADHPTVRQIWAQTLVARGVVDPELPDRLVAKYTADLQQAMDALQPEQDLVEPLPAAPPPGAAASAHSAVPLEQLAELNAALLRLPEGFTIHRKLERGRDRRAQALANPDERTIDWSTAEELAFASILADGISIRLTGEDVERGTFSHRHAVFHDVQTGGLHVPLQSLPQGRAAFEVHNSPLSENAVLGFEYGYNVQEPSRLVIWEAQYGDFINGAQVIIDEFIASARVKWGQQPSLVLLLPHAHEGQGPDHASARPERFLQLAADINIRIANCTTAAQYFHLLRRQASLLLKDPLPLVVLTPKSLLRHPLVASTPRELAESRFRMVIDDEDARGRAAEIRRVVICSGKMYVDLAGSDLRSGRREVAICRLEQLYPLPMRDLRAMLDGYGAAHEIVWVQEEPENMGAWEFVRPHLVDVANGRPVRSIARPRSASPAEGSAARHARQQLLLIEAAFAEPRPGRAMAGSRPATEQVAG